MKISLNSSLTQRGFLPQPAVDFKSDSVPGYLTEYSLSFYRPVGGMISVSHSED